MEGHDAPARFGPLLRGHRVASGLTQEALAERAGVSARGISDLERGVNLVPREDTIHLLAAALPLSEEQRVRFVASARSLRGEKSPARSSLEYPAGAQRRPAPRLRPVNRRSVSSAMAVLIVIALAIGAVFWETHRGSSARAGPVGEVVANWGLSGPAQPTFSHPHGLAVDGRGRVYVADTGNNRILVLSPDGSVRSSIVGLRSPHDVALGSDGRVYITDTRANRIVIRAADGTPVSTWTLQGVERLHHPTAITVSSSGIVWITDNAERSLKEVSSAGQFINDFSPDPLRIMPVSAPLGIAVNSVGAVYAADSARGRIAVSIGADLNQLAEWGPPDGSCPTCILRPSAVAVDDRNDVLVADAGNRTILELTQTGALISVLATARSAGLRQPSGLALDAAGHVYVADALRNIVMKLSRTGRVLVVWGSAALPNPINTPVGVAVVAGGTLLVSDTVGGRIDRLSSRGLPLASLPGHYWTIRRPAGIVPGTHGSMYAIDSAASTIVHLTANGQLLETIGGPGTAAGAFQYPLAIARDPRRNLYVADRGNRRVEKLSPSGLPLAAWTIPITDDLVTPTGIAVDGEQAVYLADGNHRLLLKLSPGGSVLGRWTLPGPPQKYLDNYLDYQGTDPLTGVVVDARHNVYVADYGGNRVVVFDVAGHVLQTLGGPGTAPGHLSAPQGLALDATGNLYVADTGNHRVQKFAAIR